MVPLSILFVLIAAGWTWRTARTKQISSIDAIAIMTLVLFIAALLWMTLVFIASYAVYSAGAWYLHSLAPLLAPLVALGLAEVTGYYRLRPFVSALVIYPLLFLPFATGVELIYFSGCLGEPAGDRHFSMANIITCYLTPSTIMKHLEVLGNPTAAISLFGSGCVLLLIGVAIIIANRFFAPACQMRASGVGGRSAPQ